MLLVILSGRTAALCSTVYLLFSVVTVPHILISHVEYLGSHRPCSEYFPASLKSCRSPRLGRARSVVVRNLDVWWRLAVEHLHVMYDAFSCFRDRTFELNTFPNDPRIAICHIGLPVACYYRYYSSTYE